MVDSTGFYGSHIMQWQIKGANAKTGDDISIQLEAASENEAIKQAKALEIFISEIHKVKIDTPRPIKPNKKPSALIPFAIFLVGIAAIIVGFELDAPLSDTEIQYGIQPIRSESASFDCVIGGILVVLVSMILLAQIPGKIAKYRKHPSAEAIRICGIIGIFLGFIFWIIAYIWAHTGPDNSHSTVQNAV
jgi:hypothetical protein